MQRNRREQRLTFTTDLANGVSQARLVFLAVGTPQSASGAADLTNLWAVGDAMAGSLANGRRSSSSRARSPSAPIAPWPNV